MFTVDFASLTDRQDQTSRKGKEVLWTADGSKMCTIARKTMNAAKEYPQI
jgi:hypothetical protein